MHAPVYHQHWAGLRGQVRPGPLLEKCLRLDDGRPIAGHVEDPIRLHVKVAVPGPGVCRHELAPVFHIESDGLEGRIEHAGIGGEQEPFRLAFHGARQGGKIRIGSAVGPLPIEPDRVLTHVHLADGVRVALILD